MAGFSKKPPLQVHHRSASIVSIHVNPSHVGCGQGYVDWFRSSAPNPNVLTGAIVGGPDINDSFFDLRNVSSQSEPTTYINAAFVGVIAKFACHKP
jgi:endoglucanase